MQAEPRPPSLNLRTLAGNYFNSGVYQLDTRRFAGIFPFEISEVDSVDCSDATQEQRDDDFAYPARSQSVSKPDNNIPTSQSWVGSVASIDERPLVEDSRYRAIHRNDHATEYNSTEINDPDDQYSTCATAVSVDSQSAMDMMWRPKPKIHMCFTDQMGLVQAKSQAIAMMQDAGLKPADKIRCRRRGCVDILRGVEALKYHLHVHNIADTAEKCNDAMCHPKTSKRDHYRSKSSFGTQRKYSMTYFPSRNISVGSLRPSHFSPHEDFPEVQHAPSFTAVAKSLVSDHIPSNSTIAMPQCSSNIFTASSTLSRSRRGGSVAVGDPATTMCLSPPSSPDMHDRLCLFRTRTSLT